MMSVDYTFTGRRKTQLYAELVRKKGSVEAAEWLGKNASEEELEIIGKHILKELEKYDPITE